MHSLTQKGLAWARVPKRLEESLRFGHVLGTAPQADPRKVSRGDRIRTCDLVLPKHPRYQTAPRPADEILSHRGHGAESPIKMLPDF